MSVDCHVHLQTQPTLVSHTIHVYYKRQIKTIKKKLRFKITSAQFQTPTSAHRLRCVTSQFNRRTLRRRLRIFITPLAEALDSPCCSTTVEDSLVAKSYANYTNWLPLLDALDPRWSQIVPHVNNHLRKKKNSNLTVTNKCRKNSWGNLGFITLL